MPRDYPFEERCHTAIRELREASCIQLDHENIATVSPGYEDVDQVFQKLSEEEGVQLSDTFRRYFFASREMHAHWRTSVRGGIVGEFCLHHIREGIENSGLVPDDTTLELEEQDILFDLRAIDSSPHGGAGQVAALRVAETPPFEIWYYDMSHRRLELLDIGYAEYLDCVLATKGTAGWQYLFADVDLSSTEMHNIRRQIEAMLDLFPEVFPDYDYAPLRARLEARL